MGIKYVNFKVDGDGQIPTKHYTGDAGWDLVVSRPCTIKAGETADVHTDLYMDMPPSTFARIVGRSSTLRKHHLMVNEGIIDNGYTGELFVCVHNLGNTDFRVKKGMRLAQIIFHTIEDVRWSEVDEIEISPNKRGNNGFGSTGV